MVLGAITRYQAREESTCLTCQGPVLFGDDVRTCHMIGTWHEDCGSPDGLRELIWKARAVSARTNAFQAGVEAAAYALPYDNQPIVSFVAA